MLYPNDFSSPCYDNDEVRGTPLHYAAWDGFMEVAKFFLESGADPNAWGTYG